MLENTTCHKALFDKHLTQSKPGEVSFKVGQLVQVYCSDLNTTLKTECKLLPKWSTPHYILKCLHNSYRLETLEGFPVGGIFSAHCLHLFIPRTGTKFADTQSTVVINTTKNANWSDDPPTNDDCTNTGLALVAPQPICLLHPHVLG